MGRKVCRVCLSGSKERRFKCLFPSAARMLRTIVSVQMHEDDTLPKHICDECFKNLKVAYNFKINCELSYEILTKKIKPDEEILLDTNINEQNCDDDSSSVTINDTENTNFVIEIQNNSDDKVHTPDNITGSYNVDINQKIILNNSEHKRRTLKTRIDRKKYGYFIIADKDNAGLEPDHVKTLHRIYKHSCNYCPRIYAVLSNFKVHVNSHMGIKPYYCEICQKNFSDKRSHVKYHKQRKEKGAFKCEHCERSYNYSGSLRTHMKIHTGEIKWFPCDQCTKKFNQLNKLNNHKLVHTGDKNFICQYCSKAFRFDRNLKAHIKSVHIKVKPHACDTCSKGFTTAYELTLHKKRHLGIKNYHCQFCSLSFVSSSEVQSHTHSVHIKDKNYMCKNCGMRFSRSSHRNHHEQSRRCITNIVKDQENDECIDNTIENINDQELL